MRLGTDSLALALALVMLMLACSGGDSDEAGDASVGADSEVLACMPRAAPDAPAAMDCEREASDYVPCSDDDGYAACISDDGEYHRIEETISTIARVQSFEDIAELLFDPSRDPSPDDFLQARMLYQIDEGLDSRVVRRYDPHHSVPDGTDCAELGVPEQFPEYCVGPALLQPLLLEAFNAGAAGDAPREQAARIEAALLWFLYVSTFKETLTCTDTIKDCDSGYAYYTGGEQARGGLGLARYVREASPYAHDRAWDGLLAVRCWRDLDDAATATDTELRDRARLQYDRALFSGVGAVLRERVRAIGSASDDAAEAHAHLAFAATLGLWWIASLEDSDSADAQAVAAELAKTDPAEVDVDHATTALDRLVPCP